MADEKTVERTKKLMKQVYDDGFNIYQCLNRVKKRLQRKSDFPAEAIMWTCEAYLQQKPKVRNHWTWFIRVFTANSERYFAEQQVAEGEKYKKEPMAQSIKDILKSI